jgi:hypothetical protein
MRIWAGTRCQICVVYLARLKKEGMVDLQTGQLQTIITICKYDVFQHGGPVSGPANGQAIGQQRASKGPEEENIISIRSNKAPPAGGPAGFEDWYAIYPKKKQPQAAKRAFAKAIATGAITLDALMTKTKAFAVATNWAAIPKRERQFIPYPASWLNAGGYHDEPDGGDGEPAPVVRDPRSFTDADWQKRLTYLQDSETWTKARRTQLPCPLAFDRHSREATGRDRRDNCDPSAHHLPI